MDQDFNQPAISPQRVVHLIPGTGHYHCGSCLRDVALAKALRRRGHDASILPLYLPLSLEEESDIPTGSIFLGGISLDLRYRFGWLNRLPRFVTGWLDSPGLLRRVSHRAEMTQAKTLGAMTVETLRGEAGSLRTEIKRLGDHLHAHDEPDVIHLSNAMLMSLAGPLRRMTSAKIICSLQGEMPFLDALPDTFRDQAWAMLRDLANQVDQFVAVSGWYGREMQHRLSLDTARWTCVHNGIDPAPFLRKAAPSKTGAPTIGFLARLCEEKGLATLCEAFFNLANRPEMESVRLCAAGVLLARDRPLVERLQARARDLGLADRFEVRPNLSLDEKVDMLHGLSVLSVPATYGESFGLYILEAHACGVPVVQPRHGAFPEILERTGGGILCEPDDSKSLANALEHVLSNVELHRQLARRGRASIDERFTSDIMAHRFETACMIPPGAALPSANASADPLSESHLVEREDALRIPSQTNR